MYRSPAVIRLMSLCAALALALKCESVAADDFVIVTVAPFPAADVEEFDPQDPPKDPPLEPGEDADAELKVEVNPGIPAVTKEQSQTGDTATVKWTIKGPIKVNVSATETIRLPTDADEQLKDHEKGHATLDQNEYEKSAKEKTEDAFRSLKGMVITGKGKGPNALADAINDAGKQLKAELDKRRDAALAAIKKQAAVLGKKYDALTNHGKNDKDGIDTAKKGIDAALAERAKALPAGKDGSSPNPEKPLSGTAPDPARVFFDAGALTFGGDLLLEFANSPTDSILSRGLVHVDPMLLIGPHSNGTIHLTDTTVQIVDAATGDLLLDAILFEPAYMPSALPNFAGMIQGYLDIPPSFAGGINNTIGSDFLAGMQAASNAGEPTAFWFFADLPLFDARGNSLIDDSGVSGALKFGVSAIPEPSTLWLLCSGVLILCVWGWRR